jgi:hypothetical protein
MKDLIDLLKSIFDEKAVAWLVLMGLAIPTIWVVYKFFVEGIKNATQKYYDLKVELYQEIARITATIATSEKAEDIRVAAAQFEQLFWGKLVLVEDRALESAMVKFRQLIANSTTGELELEKLQTRQINRKALRSGSLAVGQACFNSLQPRWLDQLIAFFRVARKGTGV